jgi:hypothetical protein
LSIWKKELRHDLTLAISGVLAKAGAEQALVEELIAAVVEVEACEEPELDDRLRAVRDTFTKYASGDNRAIAGFRELEKLYPEHARDIVAKLTEWLGLRPGGDSALPVIDTRNRIWGEIHEQAFTILVHRNQLDDGPPALFQRGDQLVRARVDEEGRPKIQVVSDAALRGRLAREIIWLGPGMRGPKIIPPPDITVKDIQARSDWPGIPPLRGVVESPTFTKDGMISVTPGYQPVSRVWFHAGSVVVPKVHEVPSNADIARAKAVLLDELLADFPFADEPSRVHAVGMLVLPVVRELVDGPTPLHAVDAPTADRARACSRTPSHASTQVAGCR